MEIRSEESDMSGPIRVLLAKIGLDGHDRGVKVVARMLRDGGMEVVYLGLHNTASGVATAALDEDVDAVGISSLSGEHMLVMREVKESLVAVGLDDVPLFAGGVVPWEDVERLKEVGVDAVFSAGTLVSEIIGTIEGIVCEKRTKDSEVVDGSDELIGRNS